MCYGNVLGRPVSGVLPVDRHALSKSARPLLNLFMEATLRALSGLLLDAIPTVFLLLIVHLYLKFMFFRPLEKVIAERRAATEGLKAQAGALLANAGEQTKAIEARLREARDQIYQEQEESRRRAVSDTNSRLEDARRKARELVRETRQQLDAEAAAAKRDLLATTDDLADQIAQALLRRKAV